MTSQWYVRQRQTEMDPWSVGGPTDYQQRGLGAWSQNQQIVVHV